MALDIFRAILCCCQPSDQSDDYETFDETMHLIIPETPEAMVGYTDDARSYHRRFRERLTEIVRSTEEKMVDVASQFPFNLHNRVIPKTESHSSSRSTLDFVDPYYSDFYASRDIARFRKERSKYHPGLGRLRSISPSFHGFEIGSSSRTRSPSPNAEQPTAVRLLNIRLVGYTDTRTRGRARERTQCPTGLPKLRSSESQSTNVSVHDTQSKPSVSPPPATFETQFPDVNAMILAWDST